MGINFKKIYSKIEYDFGELEVYHYELLHNINKKNRDMLIEEIKKLQKDITEYKATIKNIYIKGD